MSAYHVSACARGDEKGVRFSGPGVMDGCELLCWCWESKPFPLHEHVLLTAGPSFQPCVMMLTVREVNEVRVKPAQQRWHSDQASCQTAAKPKPSTCLFVCLFLWVALAVL